jgi:uncharacterized OB-fold protein
MISSATPVGESTGDDMHYRNTANEGRAKEWREKGKQDLPEETCIRCGQRYKPLTSLDLVCRSCYDWLHYDDDEPGEWK